MIKTSLTDNNTVKEVLYEETYLFRAVRDSCHQLIYV